MVTPQEMDRSSAPRARRSLCFCCVDSPRRLSSLPQRAELVFYDSAHARRTPLGALHYCLSCPGWSKATSQRVVYSRWEMVPLHRLPGFLCACGGAAQTWAPMEPPAAAADEPGCLTLQVPCGRQVDTFDADIIVDVSAHQTLCQICRGEGDVVLYRKAAADLSDHSEVFVMPDVVSPFDVFADLTFELSKINLRGAVADALGKRMGAAVWDVHARGERGAPKAWRGEKEVVHYDSQAAERTCLGHACHADCCLQPVYKITSERVLFTDWDWWYPCDEPLSLCCLPCYLVRGVARELCCAIGAGANLELGGAASLSAEAAAARAARDKSRGWPSRAFALPIGRTAHYFDIDLVADVRAHQSCAQLCRNEGDLQLCRLGGADATHDAAAAAVFTVRHVPEVFSLFDQFSYHLSTMDLSHFRQNAMRRDVAAPSLAVVHRS
ncbi:hypothetical protein AB1Y20_003505 [Prymnesium parvum]|uniref:Phospholipid scramblase n=1 Tax=Prymnesium parvum TaxID=97485 RepID=A0AB34JC74_PRYPA